MTPYEPGARILYRTASRQRQRVATVADSAAQPPAYKVRKVSRYGWIPASEVEGRCLPEAIRARDIKHNFEFEI